MGLLFAVRLTQAGQAVCLLDYRPDRAAQLDRDGISLVHDGETCPVTRVPVFAAPDDILHHHAADALLFCVKAYATDAAAAHARPLRDSDPVAVTVQNGIGNADVLAQTFGRDRVIVGTTSEGATLLSTGHVRHAGSGVTRLGSMDPGRLEEAERFCAVLSRAGFSAETTSDWRAAVWSKAIINAAINPVAALLQVPNGYLAECPAAREVVRGVAREGEEIARARGFDVPHNLSDEAIRVCQATSANRASMLQDIERGRHTELAYINDVLLREAARSQRRAPVMKTVTELARARERAALDAASS